MNDIAKARKVVEVLVFIRETLKDTKKRRKVLNMQWGICGNTTDRLRALGFTHSDFVWLIGQRWDAYKSWPKFSGVNTYPVPHKKDDSCSAYINRPKWAGQYGKDRIELLEHLIAYFQDLATVKLSNLAEATEQQVFDQVAKHLLKQGEKSQSTVSDVGRCLYINQVGLMCAAGCLVGNEQVAAELDSAVNGSAWPELVASGLVPAAHEKLISHLQHVHDSCTVESWPDCLAKLAGDSGLQFKL